MAVTQPIPPWPFACEPRLSLVKRKTTVERGAQKTHTPHSTMNTTRPSAVEPRRHIDPTQDRVRLSEAEVGTIVRQGQVRHWVEAHTMTNRQARVGLNNQVHHWVREEPSNRVRLWVGGGHSNRVSHWVDGELSSLVRRWEAEVTALQLDHRVVRILVPLGNRHPNQALDLRTRGIRLELGLVSLVSAAEGPRV